MVRSCSSHQTNRTRFATHVGHGIVLSSPNRRKINGSRASPVRDGFIGPARDSGLRSHSLRIFSVVCVLIDML